MSEIKINVEEMKENYLHLLDLARNQLIKMIQTRITLTPSDFEILKAIYESGKTIGDPKFTRHLRLDLNIFGYQFPQYKEIIENIINPNNLKQNNNMNQTDLKVSLISQMKELISNFSNIRVRGTYNLGVINMYKEEFQVLISRINHEKNNFSHEQYNEIIHILNENYEECEKIINLLSEEEKIWNR